MSRTSAYRLGSRLRGLIRIVATQPASSRNSISHVTGGASGGCAAEGWTGHMRALSSIAFGAHTRVLKQAAAAAASRGGSAATAVSSPIEKELTGLEREELEGELTGTKRFDLEPPRGPFGTKEAPAIIESKFDWRIVGCSGGVGEEEHDVIWFKLKKGENYDCPVCSQVFQLKSIPDASDDHHGHH